MIAVIYFDISSSSGEIVLNLHSFSISIECLHNSSGVSSSVCLAQKKSVIGKCFSSACSIGRTTGLGLLIFYCVRFRFIFGSRYLVEDYQSNSPNEFFVYCLLFSSPIVLCYLSSSDQWCDVNFMFPVGELSKSLQPLFRGDYRISVSGLCF